MSVRLKDRTRQIPNGFRFLQAETGFEPQPWSSFDSICQQLLTHRQGNMWLAQKHNWPMTLEGIAKEVDSYNAKLCEAHGWRAFIVQDNESPPVFLKPSLPRLNEDAPPAAVVADNKVTRVVAGVSLLADWLGAGLKPVDKELAESRAKVCLRCPINRLGDFWQRLEGVVASNIRTLMEIRSDLDLKLPNENKLYSCKACDCWVALKVHVPIEHIKDQTDAETLARLDPKCWILKEV